MCYVNGYQRKRIHYRLIGQDGPNCKICHVSNTVRQLVIDHIDNNNRNNLLENLQLLCRPCNYGKNPRVSERESSDLSGGNKQTGSSSISINQEKEQKFRDNVYEMIICNDQLVSKKTIINSISEEVDISPVTAGRYFDKMISDYGLLIKYYGGYGMKRGWQENYPKRDEEGIKEWIPFFESRSKRKQEEEEKLKEKMKKELEKTFTHVKKCQELSKEEKDNETKSENKKYMDRFFVGE